MQSGACQRSNGESGDGGGRAEETDIYGQRAGQERQTSTDRGLDKTDRHLRTEGWTRQTDIYGQRVGQERQTSTDRGLDKKDRHLRTEGWTRKTDIYGQRVGQDRQVCGGCLRLN